MCESDPNITTCHLNSLTLAGVDYTATSVVLTFLSGSVLGATQNVNISINDDNLVERPEVFEVQLLVPGTTMLVTASIGIFDNDGKFNEPRKLQADSLRIYVQLSECECVYMCVCAYDTKHCC